MSWKFTSGGQNIGASASKEYCSLKKTRHLKLVNLGLFYVIGNCESHSFDIHPGCLRPVPRAFSSRVPSGCSVGRGWAAVAEGWMGSILFLFCALQHSLLGRLQCDGLMVATSLIWFTDMAGDIFRSR